MGGIYTQPFSARGSKEGRQVRIETRKKIYKKMKYLQTRKLPQVAGIEYRKKLVNFEAPVNGFI